MEPDSIEPSPLQKYTFHLVSPSIYPFFPQHKAGDSPLNGGLAQSSRPDAFPADFSEKCEKSA